MLAGVSVDDVLAVINQKKDKPLDFFAMYAGLRAYGLPFEYVRPLHLPHIRQQLAEGKPVIALVGYGNLAPSEKAIVGFNGSHWVVVVGFDGDGFLVHDPLWPGNEGAYRRWGIATLGAALAQPGGGSMPMQGIVVQKVFDEVGQAIGSVEELYLWQLYEAMGVTGDSREDMQGRALALVTRWVMGAQR